MLKRLTRLFAIGAAAAAFATGTATAQTLTLATDAAGTTYNAIGSAVAKLLTDESPYRVIVRPFGGPDAYMDALNNGELTLATQSSSSAHLSYEGKNPTKKKFRDVRLLRSGVGGVFVGFIVPRDSDIRTVADLKGKRVASDYGGHAVIQRSVTGALRSAGLSWDDVTAVPTTGANEGVQALGAGRVDATWASLGQPVARELHAKEGIRYLGFENTPEVISILREEVFPGVNLRPVKKNEELGVPEDIELINYDAYIITHKALPDDQATALAQTLWENVGALTKAHRGLAGFTNENAVTDNPMIPYHPAAEAFYKKTGAWSQAAEQANKQVQ